MNEILPIVGLAAVLFIVVLASRQMGEIFRRFNLPLISGFLFVGVLVGPFVLDFVHSENLTSLLILDELSLAFIAFAAGAELELNVIRGYIRSIISLITGQVIFVMAFGIIAIILLENYIPFMVGLPNAEILAIAILGATIMVARSPSTALAIIKELRARGPFTHKVLGTTVLKDAVVILVFAASVSIAAALVEGGGFQASLLIFVVLEILLDIILGIAIGFVLRSIMSIPSNLIKMGLILGIGLGVFLLSSALHGVHIASIPIGLFSEPLLICMTAGFYVTNFTNVSSDFQHVIEQMSPAIFLLFFTLVGIQLELDVLRQAVTIVLFLFAVRIAGIFAGTFSAVAVARDRGVGSALLGFGFITQAGVSVGLAREIAVEFQPWGSQLATISIGVIVLNQIVGPPLLKWAIRRVGEARTQAERPEFDGVRDVIIFGVENQSLALGRQLEANGWQVVFVAQDQELAQNFTLNGLTVEYVPQITIQALEKLNLSRADGVVLLYSDEENYEICQMIYEHFGNDNVVVRLENHTNLERFHELGALVVEPGTAIVSLLDHLVRSPYAASLLLGMEPEEDFMEIQMCNPQLDGIAIRDIHFPHDLIIVSISRNGSHIVTHGYTRLELGDHVTVVGSSDSLTEVQVRFDG